MNETATSKKKPLLPLLNELLQQRHTVDISVTGLSMFPFLMPGDVVRVEPVDPLHFRVGMIIVFVQDERWIAHRLTGFSHTQQLARTRGDGRATCDAPVNYSQIKGAVTRTVKTRWKIGRFATGDCSAFIARISPVTGLLFSVITRLLFAGCVIAKYLLYRDSKMR